MSRSLSSLNAPTSFCRTEITTKVVEYTVLQTVESSARKPPLLREGFKPLDLQNTPYLRPTERQAKKQQVPETA